MEKVNIKENARSRELRILEQWKSENTFHQSMEKREGAPPFVMYEGPPTANGMPHIGHVLGRALKDFFGRYKTMAGYQVTRKAGWDTHGLPVELGVEKQLGISGKHEIENYGVEAFINKCKDSVFNYEQEWRELTEAIAYWTDLDDPYITLKNEYIESVWAILSDIHEKQLLQKGHRVSPYCPSCQTTLSSHEVAQGYKDVKDLSVIAKFKNKEVDGEYFLAWTTTPWTLPANTALAVNNDMDYVKVKQGSETYVVAHSLVEKVFSDSEYEIVSQHKGSEFVGQTYVPPFTYNAIEKGHFVIHADFVSDTSGTGIVHTAPAHGEDDYKATRKHGISMLNVVQSDGTYDSSITPFAGRFVKDCDVDIIKYLAEHGLLFSKEKYEHSYPFCWRCDSPLLYYASESWFIETTKVKEQLIANNNTVQWFPDHVQQGRFGKFLEELVDWNISRNRYWGTPLNVWECESCQTQYAPGSIADLKQRSIKPLEEIELHKPYIDEVKLTCHACNGTMDRTPEVIDVWFDSGSMPFAQHHYPFENKEQFEKQYPADLIIEGIDQTRGWFFSLLAVSTLYTGKAPYKAVIATGHILDENGQKMSKSKGNVISPWDIIGEYGTDAFRWALLGDSAPWNTKRFSKQVVQEAKSKVIDTLNNTHSFFTLYALIDGYNLEENKDVKPTHRLDRWILSRLNSTLKQIIPALDSNDILNPAKQIEQLIDELSNWYIRRSRDRFWGSGLTEDKRSAYFTLHHVLITISKMIAPYAPFIADDIYRNLGHEESVHLADYPKVDEAWIDEQLEEEMLTVRQIVELARNVRNTTNIKTRQPLSELKVSLPSNVDMTSYEEIIQDEVNVKNINIVQDDSEFVQYNLKMNLKVAGPKYGKHIGPLQGFLKQRSAQEAGEIVSNGGFTFEAPTGDTLSITNEELLIEKQAKEGFASASSSNITVALLTTITPELKQEGLVREVIRAVQDYRKQLDLPVEQRVHLTLDVHDSLREAIQNFEQVLQDNVLLLSITFASEEGMEQIEIADDTIGVRIS
ncbi:isoleucine--tRNA ligase [Longirhabdus pacifica]|uniref:isoleucine--tRNA ligase n=1 Tax=Longirhabdus pacifica TaxID=2305227 RepID=UPI0010092983|nr:isoleucine--tRNA ligase [Longirhabdus pacifica]